MVRARVSEIIGEFAILDFEGIAKIVSRSNLPNLAIKGDIVIYRNGMLVLDKRQQCVG